MKKFLYVVILSISAIFAFQESVAQCPVGIAAFTTQSQINNFKINYPNCTILNGNLEIASGNSDQIVNLQGLSNIVEVTGRVHIINNDALINLEGLNSLESIGSQLYLYQNDILENLAGLSSLESIGHYVSIIQNDELIEINGLSNLTFVNTYIIISQNGELKNLDGLSGITEMNSSSLNSYIDINNNYKLNSIAGLKNIKEITGKLIVRNANAMFSFPTFSLHTIGDFLQISFNDNLQLVDGLKNLGEIGSTIEFGYNPELLNLSGLEKLHTIGRAFNVVGNAKLEILFPSSNPALTYVDRFVSIVNNPQLREIRGLENIANNLLQVQITNNANLYHCHVTSICNHLTANRTANIYGNKSSCLDKEAVVDACVDLFPISIGDRDECRFAVFNIIDEPNPENIFDTDGRIVCTIDANGNDLGNTRFDVFQSSNDRSDSEGVVYMNRNISITPEFQPTSPVTVRIYYTKEEYDALKAADPTIIDFTDINLTKTSGGCSPTFSGSGEFIPQTNSGTYGDDGDIFIEVEVASFSTFFAHAGNRALPVEWASPLTADIIYESDIKLEFSVSQQINNEEFIIERSEDNQNYEVIGRIVGAGNTSDIRKYNFKDRSPHSGLNYYRIKQIDYDGQYSYSNIATATLRSENIDIYPNPANQMIYIGTTKSIDNYQIYDLLNRSMGKGKLNGNMQIDISTLATGTYFLRLENETKRFIKL